MFEADDLSLLRDTYLRAVDLALREGRHVPDMPAELAAGLGTDGLGDLAREVETLRFIHSFQATAHPETDLPNYELGPEVGRGTFGVVYKARDLELGRRPVAIKLLNEKATPWFEQEVNTIAGLTHPNIVSLYSKGIDRGRRYLVLRLIKGPNLRDLTQDPDTKTPAPQDPAWSAQLIATIAGAAHAAHGQGVIHRDIKPANILLEEDTPFLTDFGLARLSGPSSDAAGAGFVGSRAYAAPEQFNESPPNEVGPAADVYALGAVLYQLLTGRPPFVGSREELALRVPVEPPIPPRRLRPGLSRDLESVCLKCLKKVPHQRYGTAAELAEDLQCFLGNRPTKARPAGLIGRGLRWARRKPGWAAAIVATAFAVAIGVGWLLHSALVERRRDHDRAVAAVNAARVTGNAQLVLDLIEKPIADGYEDRQQLELIRLRTLLNANDPTFAAEWSRLHRDPKYLGATGLLDLLQADFLRSDPDRRAESDQLLAAALADRRGLDDEADIDYAQALQARGEREVVCWLEKALAANHGHVRAQRALIVARLAVGRFADARTEAHILAQMMPDDPLPKFVETFIALAEADPANPPDPPKVLRPFFAELAVLYRRFSALAARDLQTFDVKDTLNRIKQLRDRAAESRLPGVLDVPTMTLLFDGWLAAAEATDLAHRGRLGAAVARLEAARSDTPDAMLAAVEAGICFAQAQEDYVWYEQLTFGFGSSRAFRDRLRKTQELASACADAPTIMPRAPFRYQARVLAIVADLSQLRFADEPSHELRRRLVDHLNRLGPEGDLFPKARPQAMEMIIRMASAYPGPAMRTDWKIKHKDPTIQAEANRRYSERKLQLYEFCRRLVVDWLAHAPDDVDAMFWAADLEFWIEHWDRAAVGYRRVLAVGPGRVSAKWLEIAAKSLPEAEKRRQAAGTAPRSPSP